jgi:hypothetical protein
MDFEARKQKALAIMASRKMWKSNYAPLLIRLLWRLGINIPPLPFAPFWQVFVMTGYFSVDMGCGCTGWCGGPRGCLPVRLRNQSYRGRVIWPDDGTFSSVAAKGE